MHAWPTDLCLADIHACSPVMLPQVSALCACTSCNLLFTKRQKKVCPASLSAATYGNCVSTSCLCCMQLSSCNSMPLHKQCKFFATNLTEDVAFGRPTLLRPACPVHCCLHLCKPAAFSCIGVTPHCKCLGLPCSVLPCSTMT